MTLCFATWQKGRQKLRMANAGQSQPFLWHSGRCDKVDLSGFPLGLYEEATYDEWSVTLDAGDILVFHSDGLAESANREGQLYSTERLRALVEKLAKTQEPGSSAADLADAILEDVDYFSRGLPISDDRALVVLKIL
jgi:sigma-B regulation protein RsbU (phosphoserine phosphatase)